MKFPDGKIPITIDKQQMHLRFKRSAIAELERMYDGKNIVAILGEDRTTMLKRMGFSFLQNAMLAGLRHELPTLTLERVSVWVDDATDGEISTWYNAVLDAILVGRTGKTIAETLEEQEVKEKAKAKEEGRLISLPTVPAADPPAKTIEGTFSEETPTSSS